MVFLAHISKGEVPTALLLTLLLLSGQTESRPEHRFGVAEKGSDDNRGSDFARLALTDWRTPEGRGAIFHAGAERTGGLGTKVEVGLLKHDRSGVKGSGMSHNLGSVGVETGTYGGVLGRATIYDGTVHTGPVDINAGVNFDTGVTLGRNVEAKLFGLGGKVGADGIQFCVVFCVGINWG